MLQDVGQSTRLYYGGRVSYVDLEADAAVAGPIGVVSGSDLDGYRIAPTLGIEYFLTESLSLAGEAEYFFQDIDGGGSELESDGTETRLVLGYRF